MRKTDFFDEERDGLPKKKRKPQFDKFKLTNKCGKFSYPDEATALHYIGRLERKNIKGFKPQFTYQCRNCGKWHITTTPPNTWNPNWKPNKPTPP